MANRRKLAAIAGLLLAAAMTSGCAQQSGKAYAATAAARTATSASQDEYHSFLYADATSVQLLFWTETGAGTLTGEADELQNLNPGSPTFISSDLAWTGTRTGQQIIVTLPGVTILATLEGATLIRQVPDRQTGQMLIERWVPGTRADYDTLVQAFRDYVTLGQDLVGISFELQTAQQFPSPVVARQVESYLADAEQQLISLQALHMPHLPGLALPWVIPSRQIDTTITAAERFLGTPVPGTGR